MPTRTTFAPRTVPGRFVGLCGLPQCKIHRMMLTSIDFDAGTGHHVVKRAFAQFAVVRNFFHAVENVAAFKHVSKAFVNERRDHFDNIVHRFGNTRIQICAANVQGIHALEVHGDIFVGNVFPRDTLSIGGFNDFVVNVGKILDVMNFVAELGKEAADNVPYDKRAGVADMRRAVGRDSAAIDADLIFF